MPDNKEANSASPKDEALETRVDAMMDTGRSRGPVPPVGPTAAPSPASDTPPAIDIFQATKTAPEVLEEVGVKPGEVVAPTSIEGSAAAITPVLATDAAFDDPAIDEAVDDIVASDGDELLAAEDARVGDSDPTAPPSAAKTRPNPFKSKWAWLLLAVLIIAIFALPLTRYKVLGLVIKKSFTVTVLDSTTRTAVSSAQLTLAGQSAKTDGSGRATLRVPVGTNRLAVTKQYYASVSQSVVVGLRSTTPLTLKLVATGRQVPVTVINKITGLPLANAEIKVLNTNAKTDKHGQAIIVLPVSAKPDSGSVALAGYNTSNVQVAVTSAVVAANKFALTPSGSVYFLSNEHGTIDVVKVNLDGTNRQTVLAGTGKEDLNNTVLLASRDWQYLVLKSQRDSAQPALYLIDTATDKTSEFDSGNANFNLIGWYGHGFIYDVTKNNVATSQAGHEVLKSYDAERGQLNQLDQTQVTGDANNYAYQGFYNFYLLNNLVAYNTQWYTTGTADLSGKTDTIRAVSPSGQGKKDYQTFASTGSGYLQAALDEPNSVYYSLYSSTDNKTTYYKFENQTVVSATDLNQTSFTKPYPTYLLSPSGAATLWSELRDGKATLFTGDANAQKATPLGTASGYAAYGWYGDSYTLVSKGDSELFILPANGVAAPLKLTDYYKSAQKLAGYGYGYGGQ
jgi:hypothetical protein